MHPNRDSKLQLPIIDISSPNEEDAKRLVSAAADYGFFYIRSTGLDIDAKTVDGIFGLSHKFFHSPEDEKKACAIAKDSCSIPLVKNEGITKSLAPIAMNRPLKDFGSWFPRGFNLAEFANGKPQQPLPVSLAAHEATLGQFADSCKSLCMKLLELIAQGLEIPVAQGGVRWLSSRHDSSLGPSGCTLRLLFYPQPLSSNRFDEDTDVRCGAHSDYGSLTLLFQRSLQPGLEILTPRGTWHAVEVSPPGTQDDPYPPILVNVGDLFQYWTCGTLKSVVHRVMFSRDSREDRYSIAYFCHPADNSPLVPIPSSVVEQRGKKAAAGRWENRPSTMTAGEYLKSRLQATYEFS